MIDLLSDFLAICDGLMVLAVFAAMLRIVTL